MRPFTHCLKRRAQDLRRSVTEPLETSLLTTLDRRLNPTNRFTAHQLHGSPYGSHYRPRLTGWRVSSNLSVDLVTRWLARLLAIQGPCSRAVLEAAPGAAAHARRDRGSHCPGVAVGAPARMTACGDPSPPAPNRSGPSLRTGIQPVWPNRFIACARPTAARLMYGLTMGRSSCSRD